MPKGNSAVVQLLRRNRVSGEVSPRNRGRRHPDFEYGYTIDDGPFRAGDTPKELKKFKLLRVAPSKHVTDKDLDKVLAEVVEREVSLRVNKILSKTRKALLEAFKA